MCSSCFISLPWTSKVRSNSQFATFIHPLVRHVGHHTFPKHIPNTRIVRGEEFRISLSVPYRNGWARSAGLCCAVLDCAPIPFRLKAWARRGQPGTYEECRPKICMRIMIPNAAHWLYSRYGDPIFFLSLPLSLSLPFSPSGPAIVCLTLVGKICHHWRRSKYTCLSLGMLCAPYNTGLPNGNYRVYW